MLEIIIPAQELWDEENERFVQTKEYKLQMEHSLLSISKWESKWERNFIEDENTKTNAQMLDYFRCMTITQNIPFEAYYYLTDENLNDIKDYLSKSMTATVIKRADIKGGRGRGSKQVITSELIYSWMVSLEIPFECQKWPINRLLTLIEVLDIQNKKAAGKDGGKIKGKEAESNFLASHARRKKKP